MTAQPSNPELAVLPDLFLLDPKNRKYLEGTSRRISRSTTTRSRWMNILSSIFVIPLVIVFLIVGGYQWYRFLLLTNSGVVTEAHPVVRRWQEQCEGTCYRIEYTFRVEGQEYLSRSDVSFATYQDTEEGSSIEVIYADGTPHISSPDVSPNPPIDGALVILSGGGIILLRVLGSVKERSKTRQLEKGQLLRGEVTKWQIEEKADNDNYTYFAGQLDYVFYTPNARKRADRRIIRLSKKTKDKVVSPRSGAPVAVLYVSDTLYEVL